MKRIERLFKGNGSSFFIFGPRGTGKSTWVKEKYKNSLLIDLLEPDIYRSYSARPERIREAVEGNPDRSVIIIDEIQKIPQLLDAVHALIEEKPHLQFILTGSSARKLKRAGVDLLAGRALVRSLHPFVAGELKEKFNLPRALKTGLVPLVFDSSDPREVLEAYITAYIKEEVQIEGLIRNVGNFTRFLEAISFSNGALLNVSNVARECEVERKTVHSYIEILHDLLLAFTIPVFSKRAKRSVVRHSKFYFFDAGVFVSLRPGGPLDRPEEIEGAALEGLVAQHLRAWLDYSSLSCRLYYWRTKAGTEVDFILYGEDGFWAIEVKNASKIRAKDLRPLKTFCLDYPECTPIFLYRGEEKLNIDGIACLPCDTFLLEAPVLN
ncbi:MAG: ATP-binding protein [bacterium]|nr:ATP-binding protein [bacterium]